MYRFAMIDLIADFFIQLKQLKEFLMLQLTKILLEKLLKTNNQ